MPGPTPHVTWDELTTRGGVRGADLAHLTDATRAPLIRVAETIEAIRATVREPVWITSGYRHGDPRQHGAGQAADIQVRSYSPMGLLALVRKLSDKGALPHPLRQVIAESRGTGLDGVMGQGSGRWLHVAVLGVGAEPWASASSRPWLTSPDGERYIPWSP